MRRGYLKGEERLEAAGAQEALAKMTTIELVKKAASGAGCPERRLLRSSTSDCFTETEVKRAFAGTIRENTEGGENAIHNFFGTSEGVTGEQEGERFELGSSGGRGGERWEVKGGVRVSGGSSESLQGGYHGVDPGEVRLKPACSPRVLVGGLEGFSAVEIFR